MWVGHQSFKTLENGLCAKKGWKTLDKWLAQEHLVHDIKHIKQADRKKDSECKSYYITEHHNSLYDKT